MTFFIGVDVGTGSARAALVDDEGNVVYAATEEISTFNPKTDHYEQSSNEIWEKVSKLIRKVTEKSPVEGEHPDEFKRRIKGIGFAATCSLVALDVDGKPVTVSTTGDDNQNIILWMDHRASEEAKRINATKHEVLKYVGGKVSLEMEIPKILWLKNNLEKSFNRTKHFMDLADFLTWKCTEDFSRSLCTVVCKWNFMGHSYAKESKSGWDDSFFRAIGLEEFVEENYGRIGGNKIRDIGESLGRGLTEDIANELKLPHARISVASSLIDAHAGGLGMLGTPIPGSEEEKIDEEKLETRLAIISGTSTCHMAVSRSPNFCPGIWGPYFSAMIPGMWLNEGGQSATGSLIEHVVKSHPAYSLAEKEAKEEKIEVFEVLLRRLERMASEKNTPIDFLSRDMHVLPYYYGNRSPRADPSLTGMFSGLQLSKTIEDLSLHYLTVLQSIVYGTKHIIEEMNSNGYKIDTLFITGGAAKSDFLVQQHANITGCRVVVSSESAVLVGAAIVGAAASKLFDGFPECMKKMSKTERVINPQDKVTKYHQVKYQIFLKMYEDQMNYRKMMEEAMAQ